MLVIINCILTALFLSVCWTFEPISSVYLFQQKWLFSNWMLWTSSSCTFSFPNSLITYRLFRWLLWSTDI